MLGMVSRIQIEADIKAEWRGSSGPQLKAKAVGNQDDVVSSGGGTGERWRSMGRTG